MLKTNVAHTHHALCSRAKRYHFRLHQSWTPFLMTCQTRQNANRYLETQPSVLGRSYQVTRVKSHCTCRIPSRCYRRSSQLTYASERLCQLRIVARMPSKHAASCRMYCAAAQISHTAPFADCGALTLPALPARGTGASAESR